MLLDAKFRVVESLRIAPSRSPGPDEVKQEIRKSRREASLRCLSTARKSSFICS